LASADAEQQSKHQAATALHFTLSHLPSQHRSAPITTAIKSNDRQVQILAVFLLVRTRTRTMLTKLDYNEGDWTTPNKRARRLACVSSGDQTPSGESIRQALKSRRRMRSNKCCETAIFGT
jgi:hypothetical protein